MKLLTEAELKEIAKARAVSVIEIDRLIADHRRMREAIRNLEWIDGDPLQGEPRSCPVCKFYEGNPHVENCLWFECQGNAK